MAKLKYFLFIVIFSTASIACAQMQDSSASNKIINHALEFDHMEYDFGTITSDTVVTHVYPFKNVSMDTIKINKVGTS